MGDAHSDRRLAEHKLNEEQVSVEKLPVVEKCATRAGRDVPTQAALHSVLKQVMSHQMRTSST